MTSTSARSGMPGHFGIRIAKADKDKLVGELDVDTVISTTAAMCMCSRRSRIAVIFSARFLTREPPVVRSLASLFSRR